jgi:hypothetical protein
LVVVPEEYCDLGDRVLALGRMTGLGRGGGVPVDAPWGGVYDFRDGKVSRIRDHLDHSGPIPGNEDGAAGLLDAYLARSDTGARLAQLAKAP